MNRTTRVAAIVTTLLTMGAAQAQASDPARASFERMLAHLPATHSPARPAAQADDPLVAALVELLRESATEAGQLHRTQLAVVTR